MRTPRTPAEWGLDGHDRRRLARAMAVTRDLRTYRRTQAVLVVARGGTCREAALLTGVTGRAVALWVGRYVGGGRRVEALADGPRAGRPTMASGLAGEVLAREFARDPRSSGYRATTWTVPLLAEHLTRRCGCPATPRTPRRRLHAAGLSWKRPRHAFAGKAAHLP